MKKQLAFLLIIMWISLVLMATGSISMQEKTMDEGKRSIQPQSFEWQAASPESQGMSSQKLDELKDNLARRNTRTFLVIRNDKVVYEWYSPDFSATKRHGTASMAKALVGGVSLAIAINDGCIALDDVAAKYVPQWRDDPARSKITVRHLGSHTSGIEDAEADDLPHDKLTGWKGDFWKRLAVPNDPFSISRDIAPALFDPGTQFHYSNPGIGMLSYAITSALRDAREKDLRTVLRDRVMRPIGAPDEGWSVGYGKTFTVDGLPIVASWGGGAYTARAAARVGRLMLRKGNWEGTQLISEEAVRLTTSSAGLPGEIGMGWWTNADGRFASLPEDAFWASGAGHQTLLVVPSLNLICVRNGGALSSKKDEYRTARGPNLFEPLMDAITDTKQAAQPPYPHSPVIKAMALDWSTHERFAQGSDNWQLTWADDGHQYAPWGDGGGFGGTNGDGRVSLGVVRIEGPWDKYRGYNVWGGKNPENPADIEGKSWGIVCVDGVLYMWISPGSPLKVMQAEARLYQSTDHAATWQPADWSFVRADELTIPTICQFGRDYADARDEFVYHYFVHPQSDEGFDAQIPGIIHLARVPKNRIIERQAYEFFAGFDGDAKPQWSGDRSARKPVFEDTNGVGWNLSVSYNAGLKRYILMTEHTNSSKGDLGVFDAPEPWGPWTTIEYMSRSNDRQFGAGHVVDNTFFWNIPAKWQSKDGTEFSLVFTGAGRGYNNDSWNMIRGKFILAGQPLPPVKDIKKSSSIKKSTENAPYPQSKLIEGVAFSDLIIDGVTSGDQWAMTHADDGNLYAAWGDGTGVGYRGPFRDPWTASIGVARVEGTLPNQKIFNLWGGHKPESDQETITGKPGQGLICIDGVLYLFVNKQNTWDSCTLWTSSNHGLHWKNEGVVFDEGKTKQFSYANIVQYGRNYTGVPPHHENYVYWHTTRTFDSDADLARNNKDILLARVTKDSLGDRGAYEFFCGTANDPNWSRDIQNAKPIFTDPNGVNWQIYCVYNPGIKRYLLLLKHKYNPKPFDSYGFGMFEGPEPWGPWRTVYYTDDVGEFIKGMELGISYTIPTKWMSGDGKEMWMVFSGRPSAPYYSFNMIKMNLQLRDGALN